MTTQHFIVPRWRELPVEFDGEVLADVSSQDETSNRWQEIRIYRTTSGKFVTEVIGKSKFDNEHDIINVRVYRRPEQVVKGLYRKNNDRTFLTDLALEALEIAGETVPEIGDIANLTEPI